MIAIKALEKETCYEQSVYERGYKEGYDKGWSDGNFCGKNKQETILDKIRVEMFEEMLPHSGTGEEVIQAYVDGLKKGLEIIDKYKEGDTQ